jgi:outer membrane receptor protein involved in Fe transport
MRQKSTQKLLRTSVFGMALLPAAILAQSTTGDELSDDIYLLSPFEVTTESNSGYTTTETLAGTRIKTDLRDLAQSISVINTQFLKDTGATSSEDLLVYTANTEVGGIGGNFSGFGGGSTFNENSKLLRPNQNTRVRGLDAADNTRNYFLTEAAWDGYNVDRVEMQRGPNSILFGVGSPAGIVNVTSKTANFENSRSAEIRVDGEGSLRGVVDVNQVILEDELAVRVIGLDEHTKYRQKPAYEKDKRIYAAARYEPKLFGAGSTTSISVNFEHADIEANRPRTMPPIDGITPWFKSGESNGIPYPNKITLNPNNSWGDYGETWEGNSNTVYPWFRNAFMGRQMGSDISQFYSYGSNDPTTSVQTMPSTTYGLYGSLNGLPFARPWAITGYNNYAMATVSGNQIFDDEGRVIEDGMIVDGGAFYSNYSLSDPTVFDFYNNLLDGDNKREYNKWDTFNASVAQTFFNNRVGFELSYFWQNYEDGQTGFLGGEGGDQYAIGIDINTHFVDGTENPNVGKAYVANSGQFGSSMNAIDRNSVRLTGYVDIKASDFLEEGSALERILGHHLISGLLSRDIRKNDYRTYARWALDTDYTDATGLVTGINDGTRMYNWVYYLNDENLSAYDSASGLYLSNVDTIINPTDSVTVNYFDSHWNPDCGYEGWEEWVYTSYDAFGNPTENYLTQSENPDNYYGWTTETFNLLNADDGDIDSLYRAASKSKNRIASQGITLQSYMLDDNLVFTYGWRKDKVKTISANAPKLENDVSDGDFVLNDSDYGTHRTEGQSRTWGVVLHSPEFINKHLPWDMRVSAFYGKGKNFKADAPRGDVFGNQIANPKGNTEDYGFAVSVLDNKYSLKVTWYTTEVYDADLPYDSAGIGSANLYYAWAIPYWGATHAMNALDGVADPDDVGTSDHAGYRQNAWWKPWTGIATNDDGTPDKAAIYESVQDFFGNFPLDQHFLDEYGLDLDLDLMRQASQAEYDPSLSLEENLAVFADYYAACPSYTGNGGGQSGLGIQPAYGGSLKSFGTTPVAAGDTISEGIEFEFNARITDNWNMMLNVSKTDATVTKISEATIEWVETFTEFLDGPAGDLRLWGGDTFRNSWRTSILTPYYATLSKVGSGASEVSPWRANFVTNYNFTEGFLKGVSIGMAYRWEDKRILGYQTTVDDSGFDVLDVTKPWKGPTEDHIDMWIGYGRAITDNIDWRIQLNIRNVGESNHLVPVYIQPDGSVGYSRIAYGTSWFLTNTFTF